MKVEIVTMVYANDNVFKAGMKSLYSTVDMKKYRHHVLNCHYPLNPPDLFRFSFDKGCDQWDSGENLGLHGNANYILRQLDPALKDEDIMVFYDADEGAEQPGWLEAMVKVFEADPKCGWLSVNAPSIMENLDTNKVPITEVGGIRVRVPPYCLMNLICAWRVGALRAIGPLNEPHTWYGGLEIDAQPKFRENGFWVGWLQDFTTQPHHHLADQEYQSYKQHHVGFQQPVFTGSFEEWLKR